MPFHDDEVIKARIDAYVRQREKYEEKRAQVERKVAVAASFAALIMKMLGM